MHKMTKKDIEIKETEIKGYKFKLVGDDRGTCYINDDDFNNEPIKYDGSDSQIVIMFTEKQLMELINAI